MPGPVVVGEDDRALVRPGRDDDRAGPDAPHPLAGEVFRRRGPRWSVRRSSASTNPSSYAPNAVVRCRCSTSGYAASSATAAATQSSAGAPSSRSVPDSSAPPASDCSSTRSDAGPGPGGAERGGQARGPRAHHEHVDVVVHGVVARGVRDVGQAALARQTVGHEAVVELHGGRSQHRLGERLLDLHEAARVLRPGRGDAAGASELDARADPVRARGEQRRGEGVAGVPGVSLAVEGEGEGGGAVDAAARGGAEAVLRRRFARKLAHGVTGFCSSRRYTRSKR